MKEYSEIVINAFTLYTRTIDLMNVTGLSRSTIVKYKKDNGLLRLVNERRGEVIKEAGYNMQSELTKTVKTLVSIRDNEEVNAQTRAYVCNLLLTHCREWTQSVDIIERLEALEKVSKDQN